MSRTSPRTSLSLTLAALLACAGCRPAPEPPKPPGEAPVRLAVGTTCFPVDWLVARIGGDLVARRNVLPPGEDPPEWEPTAEIVAELAKADRIVVNGAGYEKWMLTAALPTSRVVDTARGLDLIEIRGVTHSHGPKSEHSHAGTDPHTWTDPVTYLAQARAVQAALAEVDPGNRPAYEANLAALERDLTELDATLARSLESAPKRLASNHPSFGYLARRYGLTIEPFSFDPESAPAAGELGRLARWSKGQPVILLWEAPPAEDVVRAFPPGVRHVTLDPLEQPPSGRAYDYLAQAWANAAILGGLHGGREVVDSGAKDGVRPKVRE